MKLKIALVVVAAALSLNCSRTRTTEEKSATPEMATASAPQQLSSIQIADAIHHVRDRFDPEGKGFVGRAERLSAHVNATGELQLIAFDPNSTKKDRIARLAVTTSRITGALVGTQVTTTPDGVLRIQHGSVRETWTNRGDGFEQAWHFDARPADGAIEIEISARGLQFAGRNDHGLVFQDTARHLEVSYSDATFIDADGARTAIPATYVNGKIQLHVPAEAVKAARFPAVLDPFISAQIPLDGPVLANAAGNQRNPTIAFNGSSYLVAWEDGRNPDTDTDLWGARLNSSGVLIDPVGFIISNAPAQQTVPVAVSDGTNFAVTWVDQRNSSQTSKDIFGTRILANGSVVSPDGLPLVTSGVDDLNPTLTYDVTSGRYLLAWNALQPLGSAQNVFAAVLDANLTTVLGPLMLGPGTGQNTPTVARISPNTVLVAWLDPRNSGPAPDVYAGRIDLSASSTSAAILDPGGYGLVTNNLRTARVALGAASPAVGGALLVWTDLVLGVGGQSTLMARRLNSAGQFADTNVYTLDTSDGGYSFQRAAVQTDGSRWHVLYTAPSFLAGPLFRKQIPEQLDAGANGAPYARELIRNGAMVSVAAAHGSPSGAFVVYGELDLSSFAATIHGGQLDQSPLLVDGGYFVRDLARAANAETSVAIGASQDMSLIAWADQRNPQTFADIYAVRVNWDGGVLDSLAIPVGTSPLRDVSPAVAGSPQGFIVGWTEVDSSLNSVDAGFALVGLDGTLGSPEKILLSGATTELLACGWDGTQYVVLLNQNSAGKLARITPLGAVQQIADIGTMSLDPTYPWARMVTANGKSLVVSEQGFDVFGQLITTNGGGVNASPVFAVSADPAFVEQYPSVAANGSNYLVSWCDERGNPPNTNSDVWASIVDQSGIPGAAFPVALDGGDKARTTTVWDGQHYAVFWEERDGGSAFSTAHNIRGRYLNSSGTPLTDAFAVQSGFASNRQPAAASFGSGRTLLAFSEFSLAQGSARAYAKTVRLTVSNGEQCSTAADCESGFCTDGVCCDSACGNGDVNDCQACSLATGATANGQCTLLPTTHECRPGSTDPQSCEAAEFCDGVSTSCPADIAKPQGTECRPSAGPCDVAETCDGTSRVCPTDVLFGTDVVCREAAKVCDAPEKCDGQSPACPSDVLAPASSVCRPAANGCDTPEMCSGTSDECPADAFERDGLVCSDVTNGVCSAGQCVTKTQDTHYGLVTCGCGSADGAPLIIVVALLGLSFRRRRGAAVVAVLIAVGLSSTARAADPEKMKLSYLGLKAGAGISLADADTLSNYVQSQITALEVYDVIGQSEIAAIVGQERQKMLLGCSDEASSCLAEIAGALNAQRVVNGDVAVVGQTTILNLSLIDMNDQKLIKRVAVKADGTTPEVLIDQVPNAVVQLASADPKLAGQEIHLERGFGGVMAGVRGDGDVVGRGFSPGVMAELSGKHFGGALTVLLGATAASNGTRQIFPGLRAEARFFPIELGLIRPYIAAGASVFAPDVAARGAVGLAVRFGSLQLFADAAYERFFNPRANDGNFHQDAVLVGAGAGWQF